MTPKKRYKEVLEEKQFQVDKGQLLVVDSFEYLHQQILQRQCEKKNLLYPLLRLFKTRQPLQGLYIWGGVGRGKTWLMDLFYESLPIETKYRQHFHRYIQEIHEKLESHKGQKNPLKLIARQFARQYQILCLDEFHVSDITDAMILYGLLKSLIECNVQLVFTSNLAPEDLYRDGLQRERFIPAIELINKVCKVQKIKDGVDHRLNTIKAGKAYFTPLTDENRNQLETWFEQLIPCPAKTNTSLEINHRSLPAHKLADDVAWFIFDNIFNSPRAVADYIELARLFHTVVISDIPFLDVNNEDKTRRFIQLMDEFYDRNVKVIISAADQPENLYMGTTLKFEFERTISRIKEMQSTRYLQKPHKA